eukprot:TRINITY_DN67264_c0_g1_i1.p1 TRINITY_DN67264_c0_g1~~TRINITY_DN67264_c0_g1_i1.p1  ORF type:complete len:940 (-),score=144.81 TRINITY_DN67264_c0_g1_i1:171-2990(-)
MDLSCGSEEGDAVQVAVRMRIFNGREKGVNAERIVRMENLAKGSKTYITDPDTREERDFKYDFSFQSHSETEPGIGDYATQETVMQTLGIPVLNAALEGRNVSLFAYGQTGAGKSFSMLGKVGIPELEGIIPRSCKEIFKRMVENTNPLVAISVDIQVVEVYCEMINDLLADRKQWPANGHKPRLTPKYGYVVDTTTKPCFNYDDIGSAMEFADKNRSIGSHALNPESSRAHTIYQINYAKVTKNEAGKVVETVTAKLNLIDLAGSERTDSAGTTGQMLKEGNAINLSLTALGGCIKALSEGKKPNFRDSKLTLLLQASMTGGKVIMIAALSPASICYAETLSTLKFADRIKQVKIKSSKNVSTDPVAEMKKAMEELRLKLQSEIDALRSQAGGVAIDDPEKIAQMQGLLEEKKEAEEKMKEDLLQRIKELEGGGGEREKRAKQINNMQAKALSGLSNATKTSDEKRPHFRNLHDDPRLAETLVYPFEEGKTAIGRMDKANPPKIEFNGMGIIKGHCEVDFDKAQETVFITPFKNSRTLVNGKKVTAKTQLFHQNRVWLGNNYALRFCYPGREDFGEGLIEDPDYFVAETEVAEHMEQALNVGEGGGGNKGDILTPELRHKLADAERKIDQANIIATDLEKEVIFAPKIYENRLTKETDVVVSVNFGGYSTFTWPWAKFNTRLADMVNMWTEWQAAEVKGEEQKPRELDCDPFVDQDPQLIGEADVWLNALANMVEFSAQTSVLSHFGQVEGKMSVELQPCDSNGNTGPWDDDDDDLDPFVDDPQELLGETITFEVWIHGVQLDVSGGGVCKYEKTFVRYKFDINDDEEVWSQTKEDPMATFTPKYKFKSKHKIKVTPESLKHITTGRMIFQLWGTVSAHEKRPATANEGGLATRLEAKRKELKKVELQLEQKEKVLRMKQDEVAQKRKLLIELGGTPP